MIKVICVAYDRPIKLRLLIDSFLLQTNPDWELNIIYDGPPTEDILCTMCLYDDKRILFRNTPERTQNYGHLNRKMMLDEMQPSTKDFVLMTNDDNYYVPVFIEYLLNEINGNIGFVYCDTVHSHFKYVNHKTQIKLNLIDMGAFIVRLDMAKRVGFNDISFNADGFYAEKCLAMSKKHGLKEAYIPKPLFVHN